MKLSVPSRWAAGAAMVALAMFTVGCSDDGQQAAAVGATDDIAAACLSVEGTLSSLNGGAWDCGDIPMPDDAGYAELDAFFAPFCASPLQLSSGWTSENPPTAGWSCWEEEAAQAAPATEEEACALVAGAFGTFDEGGWTCRDVPVDTEDAFVLAQETLAPFCDDTMELTNGWLGDDPPLHGWSCSPLQAAAASTIEEACAALGATFVPRDGGEWTCEQVEVGASENYSAAEEYFMPFCVAPMVLTSGVSSEGPPLIAGFSCSNP